MADFGPVPALAKAEPATRLGPSGFDPGYEVERLRAALAPFAAMGRVMEIRATMTFGKMPLDREIVCESSGEAGIGILTMGHFRDAAALLPKAPGWSGAYVNPGIRTQSTGEQPAAIARGEEK